VVQGAVLTGLMAFAADALLGALAPRRGRATAAP
jgi:hypothetical protein